MTCGNLLLVARGIKQEEGLGGDGAPGLVLRCLARYALLAELTEDDGEVLVGEARALRERALRLINR